MGAGTSIEWATHTFNPFIGCTKVSPACANCYAERYGNRFGVGWGPGKPRRRTSPSNWRKPLAWNRLAERARKLWAQCGAVGHPPARPRVFCASLADWLDHEVPIEWLADLLALVAATPDLDWLLLTKRPHLWRERLQAAVDTKAPGLLMASWWLDGDAPENVWLGVTVEDQQRADERIPHLLSIPARVRFLSCEPLLGPVVLPDTWPGCFHASGEQQTDHSRCAPRGTWIIAGGESGPNARPSHPEWFRSLRDQAQAAGAAFLFKQHGEWVPEGHPAFVLPAEDDDSGDYYRCVDEHPSGTTPDGRISTYVPMANVGREVAGREFDGRTWDELPRVLA